MCSLNNDLVRVQIGHGELHRQIVVWVHVGHLIHLQLGPFVVLMALGLVLLVVGESIKDGSTHHALKKASVREKQRVSLILLDFPTDLKDLRFLLRFEALPGEGDRRLDGARDINIDAILNMRLQVTLEVRELG